MSSRVQSVRPAPHALMYEGLLGADEPKQMVARAERGQGFQQILISAEARSRVELWREYTPPTGVDFSAVSFAGSNGWLIGDNAGNLHSSLDGLTWEIVKKFDSEITGIHYDGQIESWTWLCTKGGELWQGLRDYETKVWTWTLAYSDPSLEFAGVGMSDERVVVIIKNSKNILRSADADGAPWTIAEVWPSMLYPFGCTSDMGTGVMWVASYTSKPYYTDDGGLTWTQTPAAAGNAVASVGIYNGTVICGGPGGIWRTVDNGVTWTTEMSDGSTFFKVAGNPSGWFALNGSGEVFTSTDDGVTWNSTGQRAVGDGNNAARPVDIVLDPEHDVAQIVAVCNGSVLVSNDSGATWTAGAGGEAWRISVEAYQPVLLDLPYEVPANERLVGAASEETFVLVGG